MAMEQETNKTLSCVPMDNEVDPNPDNHQPFSPRLSEKKRNPFQSLKAAIYLLSKKSSSTNNNSESKPVDSDAEVPSKGGFWRTLLGSMRPMHAQNNMQSPPPSYLEKRDASSSPERDELFTPPPSPPPKCGINSKYASALNLQELDNEEEKKPHKELDHQPIYQNSDVKETDVVNGCNNNDHQGEGDEMIDTKAEDFINQFYEQMRLQKSDSTNSYNAGNEYLQGELIMQLKL